MNNLLPTPQATWENDSGMGHSYYVTKGRPGGGFYYWKDRWCEDRAVLVLALGEERVCELERGAQ